MVIEPSAKVSRKNWVIQETGNAKNNCKSVERGHGP